MRKLKILLIKMSIIQSVFRKPVFLVGKDGLNKTTVCSLGRVYVFGPFAQQETPNVFAVKALSSPGTQRSKPGVEAGRREGVTPQEPPPSQSAHRHGRGALSLPRIWRSRVPGTRLGRHPSEAPAESCLHLGPRVLTVQVLRCRMTPREGGRPRPGRGGDSGVRPARVSFRVDARS